MNVINNLYANMKGRIVTEHKGNYFSIKRGVKQRELMSSALFNCLLEQIFQELNWERKAYV